MLSQPADDDEPSLVEYLIGYLLKKGELTEEQLKTFKPSVCNRLDRNTSGMVCAGKSLSGLQFLSRIFHDRTLHKYYLCLVKGKLDKPAKELKAFVKTKELEPGEEQEVTAEFAAASMASYDTERAAWVLEKGDYQILYGNCSEGTKLAGIVELDADAVTEKVKNICPGWGFEDWKPEKETETKAPESKAEPTGNK